MSFGSAQKGISGLLNSIFRRQPVEQRDDPIRRQYEETRNNFLRQQDDFRQTIEEMLARMEQPEGSSDAQHTAPNS